MRKELVRTGPAPMNLPFSPGIKFGDLIFVSGQGPIEQNGKVVQGDVKSQTKTTLENFRRVLVAAQSGLEYVLQTTVYLSDLNDYSSMNEVYSTFFPDPKPARTAVRADLLFGMRVEIQGIAYVPR
jgi:2-iminobutanoate/2-iminopropanoate deaminase